MFDIAPVIIECRAYIDTISDYYVETTGKTVHTPDTTIEYGSKVSIKVLLIEFLFECKVESSKGELNLIQFLRGKKDFWRATQGQTIGKLNEIINRKSGIEKNDFEDQKTRFFNFFHYNYTLIDLIQSRLLDVPLRDLSKINLEQAGLHWIVDGHQPPGQSSPTTNQYTEDRQSLIQDKATQDEVEKREVVRRVLAPLGGKNPQKQDIMLLGEYRRLLVYTDILVIDNTLPTDIQPIPQTGISNEHIRFTFYLLHKELFGRKRHPAFIQFIHSVFEQFKGTKPETTHRKFSTSPQAYEKDFAGYFGDFKSPLDHQ